MTSSKSYEETPQQGPRYSEVNQQKATGATYTPVEFAAFVAAQMLRVANIPKEGVIRVLDPAVGDGVLLEAFVRQLPEGIRARLHVVGYDTDSQAVRNSSSRLKRAFPSIRFEIEKKDFLDYVLTLQTASDLFFTDRTQEFFHFVIANPPYVRTQIMGSSQAQILAQSFGLTGRVDLYYPFLLGISRVLSQGGVAGVITSNRFMTTKSGQAVRRALLSNFDISQVWDLGDTKLFEAAVLPSVLIASAKDAAVNSSADGVAFSSIYETEDAAQIKVTDLFAALTSDDETVVVIPDGRRFRVRHGCLDNSDNPEGIWRIGTVAGDQWMATVQSNTWDTFRRIGKIRVGVKSTADKIFIRNDWSEIPGGRPELLRNLITRHCARRFKADIPAKSKNIKEILYPHEVTEAGRRAVDLSLYPKSAKYLEQHRTSLEARTYLIEAGRNWYELWVPQNPAAWPLPKLVFPDISEKPIFWLDTDGGVVNGECYWLQCERVGENDLLWLALAVANSTFIEAFYDHKFNNKLYAGRRRFITQYVEQFPLPDPKREEASEIVAMVKEIHANIPSKEVDSQIEDLNNRIWRVFGLDPEKVSG